MQDDRMTEQKMALGRRSAELRVPGALTSMGMAFAETATAPLRAGYDITQALQGLPATNALDNAFNVANVAMQTPNASWTQKTGNFIASGIGYLDPLYGLLAFPATKAVSLAARGLSRAVPAEMTALARTPIKNFGIKGFPETVGGAGEHIAKVMAGMTAISAPEALLDNYDKATDTFNIPGAAKQAFVNGTLALALDGIGVAAGAIFGKHKKAFGHTYETPMPGHTGMLRKFDKFFQDGELTKDEHLWIQQYLTGTDYSQEFKKKGIDYLQNEGYLVDHANQTMTMNLMNQTHIDTFHTGMIDQISASAIGNNSHSLTDYATGHMLDFIRENNEKHVDGIGGYIDYMGERLKRQPENMEAFSRARKKEALEHINDGDVMSQKHILKELKDVNHDIRQVPYAIPKKIRYIAKLERDISKATKKLSNLRKRLRTNKVENNPNLKKLVEKQIHNSTLDISKLKGERKKFRPSTPGNEFKEIEEYFLGEKGQAKDLPKDYQHSHEYHRLVDLSLVSKKASALLHQVDLNNKYEIQRHMRDMVKYLKGTIESPVDKYANPDSVIAYMSNRKDSFIQYPQEMNYKGHARNQREVPIDSQQGIPSEEEAANNIKVEQEALDKAVREAETIIQDDEADIAESGSQEFANEHKIKVDRYKQFSGNLKAMSNLMSCDVAADAASPEET